MGFCETADSNRESYDKRVDSCSIKYTGIKYEGIHKSLPAATEQLAIANEPGKANKSDTADSCLSQEQHISQEQQISQAQQISQEQQIS